jgi:type II secretory pathway pseudopilin PulG
LKPVYLKISQTKRAFTVLELLVAVSVTALLAGLLLNITSQVVQTQTQASGNLETNQVAQFVLDRIQEDLQCAVYRNDGNVWMAADILDSTDNSRNWVESAVQKPVEQSLRILIDDWPEDLVNPSYDANLQGPISETRNGISGTWLRFFTEAPELDPNAENSGGARAISYQIIRHGLTSSVTSTPRYQLFRSDVSDLNTFEAGYNLHPTDGGYTNINDDGPRESGNVINPIFTRQSGGKSTDFSLASNIVDFGMRAYLIRNRNQGTGYLQQIYPDLNSTGDIYSYLASSHPLYRTDPQRLFLNAFPDVVDIMVRVLTAEGASALAAYEDGLIPPQEGLSVEETWWELVEQNSEVYVRRIRILSKGL